MARLRASWRTSLPVVQQPRNPQSESIARTPYKMASVRSGLEGSQGPLALRGTLPAEDNQLHSELDNGSAPVPSTPEPVSSPALSQAQAPPPPLAPAALEK